MEVGGPCVWPGLFIVPKWNGLRKLRCEGQLGSSGRGGTSTMGRVTRALEEPPVSLGTPDSRVIGTACCLFAAVSYTMANICLRSLADTAPAVWTICVRELVGVLAVTPWFLWGLRRGVRCLPDSRSLRPLIVSAAAAELVGNVGLQWAFQVIGLSVAMPVAIGVSLAVSAVLGWLVLGERVTRRSTLAVGMLVVAIVILKLGADQGPQLTEAGILRGLLAIAVSVAGGCSFAWLSVAMRQAAVTGTPLPGIALVVTGTGVLLLGPLSLWQYGPAGLVAVPLREMSLMLLTGALNLAAFLAIAKGLHLTTIVHANLVSASQVAMAAVAGMVLFGEASNRWIVLGIVLTLVSMIQVERPAANEEPLTGV